MKTLSERITEAQTALTVKKDALVELTKQLDETPDDDSLLTQLDEQTQTVEKATNSLNTLEKAEKALAERAQAIEDGAVIAPPLIHGKSKDASNELWLKSAVCKFISHINRTPIEQVMAERYKGNRALEAIQKTAVPIATTYGAGWAAELTKVDVQGFVDLLTPTSVCAALSKIAISINFDGFNSVTVPRRAPRTAGTSLGGAFVGEAGAIPLGRLQTGATVLARYKHAVISTFSRELADRSTPQIEALLRKSILDDMSISLDSVFLSVAAGVAGVQPAGIGSGLVPLNGTAGGGVDAVVTDIKAGLAALAASGYGTTPVLIANANDLISVGFMQTPLGQFVFRDELQRGQLLGLTVIGSLNVTPHTAYILDAECIATAFDSTEFNISDVATVVEANADAVPPTHATDTAGTGVVGNAGQVPRAGGIPVSGGAGAAMAGAVARSLWQTFSIGIRSVQPVSWGVVGPGGVIAFVGLTW